MKPERQHILWLSGAGLVILVNVMLLWESYAGRLLLIPILPLFFFALYSKHRLSTHHNAKQAGSSANGVSASAENVLEPVIQVFGGVVVALLIICGTESFLTLCHSYMGTDIADREVGQFCVFEQSLLRSLMLARRSKDAVGDLGVFVTTRH